MPSLFLNDSIDDGDDDDDNDEDDDDSSTTATVNFTDTMVRREVLANLRQLLPCVNDIAALAWRFSEKAAFGLNKIEYKK